jgi:RNA-directed DNA polymerase
MNCVNNIQCASVATVLFWDKIDWNKVKQSVISIQRRIVKALKNKRFNKVKALQWILTNSFHAKLLAVKRVTSNKGGKTAGIDHVVWKTSQAKEKAVITLNKGRYKAYPLKRKLIPKKNGKMRTLGIPIMYDRAMQALFKMAIEPVAEALADPNSYGFRAKRQCADAIEHCYNILKWKSSAAWIFEADILACFDEISQKWVLKNIPLPKPILRQWLKAGYIDKNNWFPTDKGTPQGGIISPIIANMVLDGMQELIEKNFNKRAKVRIVRYADDFIITAISKEILLYRVKPLIDNFLKERGLELSAEKTKITHINEGFDFLGQNLKKYGGKLLTKPSKKSIKSIYRKIRQIVKSRPTAPAISIIATLNPIIRGWANYHHHIVSKRVFNHLDNLVFRLLWNWAKRRHPNKPKRWIKKKYFKSIGKRRWVFAAQLKNKDYVKLIRFEHTKIVRHIKIKSAANPFDADWQEYFTQRDKMKTAKKRK